MQNATPPALAVLVLELIPAGIFGCAAERVGQACARWPAIVRIALPALCVLPYVWISSSNQMFSWGWCALYTLLPVAMAWLLARAAIADPEQRGNWRDAIILLTLGLAVDLRWFEPAWPSGLAGLGKLLLVDAGLYGFLAIRRLSGTGFDFHFRWSDWKTGLRELIFFAPLVLGLGLALGFLHPHRNMHWLTMVPTWAYIFIFVAVPEELFFAPGRKICWNGASEGGHRWRSRLCSSVFLISINAPRISTGALCSGEHSLEFATEGLSATTARARFGHHTRQRGRDLEFLVLKCPRRNRHIASPAEQSSRARDHAGKRRY